MSDPDEPMPSFRPRLFTRGAAVRLGLFAAALAIGTLYGWNKTIRMPGRSYAGALAPLSPEEAALRGSGGSDRRVPRARA
jgi:hypothetical protein